MPPGVDPIEFIQNLPKTETHLHLEGALPLEFARQLSPAEFNPGPYVWNPKFRYTSFQQFEEFFGRYLFPWFTSPERYRQVAAAVFADLVRQKVRYVEISFHLGHALNIGVSGQEIVQAIRAATPPNLEVRVFAGMRRLDYTGAGAQLIDACLTWPELTGIDLHGFEGHPLLPWTAGVWAAARAQGKFTKAHAGEFGGADQVQAALTQLGVNRIEHGVRALEDPRVIELLLEREATLDVCPLSNVKLGVVPNIAEHPLRQLLAAGVRCTINSDDPIAFGNSLTGDYLALYREGGFSLPDLVQLAGNGFAVALVAPTQKEHWLTELAAYAAALS